MSDIKSNNLPIKKDTFGFLTTEILDYARNFSEKNNNQTVELQPVRGLLGKLTFVGNHRDAVTLMKTIEKTESVPKVFKPTFGESVFNQQSDKWKEHRSKFPFELLPEGWFHEQIPIFKSVINKVCKKYLNKKQFNLFDFSKELVISIKIKMTFGIDLDMNLLNYLNYQQNDIDRQLKYNLPPLSPWYYYGRYMWKRAINKLGSRTEPTGNDLLSYLLRNNVLINQQMKDEFNAIFWGGVTSFSSTVSSALYHIRHDIDQEMLVNQDSHNNDFDYSQAAFKETLRLYPGAPLVIRKLKYPIVLGGCPMEKDRQIIFCPYISQNDKKDWKNPTKYDLKRHLKYKNKILYQGFMPFGVVKDLGGRGCAGYKFVMVAGPLIIRTIINEYNLLVQNEHADRLKVKSYSAAYVTQNKIYAKLRNKI